MIKPDEGEILVGECPACSSTVRIANRKKRTLALHLNYQNVECEPSSGGRRVPRVAAKDKIAAMPEKEFRQFAGHEVP